MAKEQTFRSPAFYEREIDLSAPTPTGPSGVPAGVISTAKKGPAFVPVTLGNMDEFRNVFGGLDSTKFGPYAVNEFLKYKSALTFMRVLGAGANKTSSQISSTQQTGRVTNAGVKFEGNVAADDTRGRHNGAVQFLTARHDLQANEAYGMPMFTDNNSYAGSAVNLVRGAVIMASGSRLMVLDGDESSTSKFTASGPDDAATLVSGKFKLVISSTLGATFANSDGIAGVRILTASFDPSATDYFAKVLNTDPDRFSAEQHYLYADFAVDNEVATATYAAVVSGSANTSDVSGETTTEMRKVFGAFDTRYKSPKTPSFISQPFGNTEYDLFHFEALDDGEYANSLYKISISNVAASLDDSYEFGTFTVEIRDFNDTDVNPNVLERYPLCNLDPNSDRYVAKLIGDRKVYFNFDATVDTERRVVTSGKYPNQSRLVRIVMNSDVEEEVIPQKSLPFGFRGPELLKTNDALNDTAQAASLTRLAGILGTSVASALSGSILPPVPMRFKVTKGSTLSTATWEGQPGPTELANSQLYWGVKFERNTSILNPNVTSEPNKLIKAFTKFAGIKELDSLVTGSGADTFNNNKFTLAKVALSNGAIAQLTSSVDKHMKEAAYIRDGVNDTTNYTINDGVLGSRVTLGTILATDTAANFNRFSTYAKFTTFMYGGYDGVNFLDRDARRMNDKASSFDTSGAAESSYVSPGLLTNVNGTGQSNNTVYSYKTAIDIMTDPLVINTNILAIPGIKESFLTDYAARKVREYGLAYYVMDIPSYDDSGSRLYDDSSAKPDVDQTASKFDTRAVDNSYCGTYFPDVSIDDAENNKRVWVPASVAALSALSFNDKIAYPWFAPAGFNRASLDFVKNVKVRLNNSDKGRLQDSRINPIATFPRLGFVIFGQKTLQIKKSARDRVNVRRLLLEVKRIITGIARNLVFENNTPDVRNKFVADANQQLALIKALAGIERFDVVMNESNNTREDIDLNRLRGRIVVVPTRTIEFVSIDFIVTNSGVSFL